MKTTTKPKPKSKSTSPRALVLRELKTFRHVLAIALRGVVRRRELAPRAAVVALRDAVATAAAALLDDRARCTALLAVLDSEEA